MTRELMRQEDYYRTSDMALAAVISLSHPIEEVDRQNPRKAQFIFCRTDDLDQLVDAYWKGQLQVEPQQFFNQVRHPRQRRWLKEWGRLKDDWSPAVFNG